MSIRFDDEGVSVCRVHASSDGARDDRWRRPVRIAFGSRWRRAALVVGLVRAIGVALAASGEARAQDATCAGAANDNCNSQDVKLAKLSLLELVNGCTFLGDYATVKLKAEVSANANERYDVGFFVAVDGGNAFTGTCYHDILPPALATGSGVNPSSGIGPYLNLEGPTDLCGDVDKNTTYIYNLGYRAATPGPASGPREITIPCIDSDGNGEVDVRTVVSWDHQSGNKTASASPTPSPTLPSATPTGGCRSTSSGSPRAARSR